MWPRVSWVGRNMANGAKRWRVAAVGRMQPARYVSCTQSLQSMDIKMPSLSPTMTEGTIVGWKIKEGDSIGAGEVLAEIQTDKAVVSLEVDEDGTLAKIIKNADSGPIQVGELIAVLAEDGEDWKEVAANAKTDSSSQEMPMASQEEEVAGPSGGSTPGTQVKMPAMSPTMTEGTLVKWSVKV